MQSAETVLGVLRERGRRGLPCDELYRQLFNPQLYLLAYGRIYSNKGAMTPGVTEETADGMSMGKIGRIIDAMRHERYRFHPVKRIYIPKKNGSKRPLGLPSGSVEPCPPRAVPVVAGAGELLDHPRKRQAVDAGDESDRGVAELVQRGQLRIVGAVAARDAPVGLPVPGPAAALDAVVPVQ
jgi:hypothetical protein